MSRLKSTALYGGALVCDLPGHFIDVRWGASLADNAIPPY